MIFAEELLLAGNYSPSFVVETNECVASIGEPAFVMNDLDSISLQITDDNTTANATARISKVEAKNVPNTPVKSIINLAP